MLTSVMLKVPLNRVEGDLELRVELEGDAVTDAWSTGTMYRGFERILLGRGARDGLVITPRVCGICGTAHLTAAARALDMIAGAHTPPDALKLRNIALMTEHVQSDMRHSFLMFTADFCNPAYGDIPLYAEAKRRYEPFAGETVLDVITESKRVLEIIAILGGQWPHSSYMVPGGVTSMPSPHDLNQCQLLLSHYRDWYEKRILGCPLERWLTVRSRADLDAYLGESSRQADSELGFFVRYARQIGLDHLGGGHGNFVSFGSLDIPDGTQVQGRRAGPHLVPAGFARGTEVRAFSQEQIAEHVAYSWFEDYPGGRHPLEGETRPYATGAESEKYSWCKAPRYAGAPAETGPLAEMIIAGNPLFTDLIATGGPNVFVRQLARLARPAELIPAMGMWLDELRRGGPLYCPPGEIIAGQGFGLTQASRGALGHWVKVADGQIRHYQMITPTAWNASPRDSDGIRGPWEEALIGTRVKDATNPVELGHVVRSFDACLVCTVHALRRSKTTATLACGGFR